ncbi:hypothetical protein AAG570_009242 [Ranatra chinensis]|uniref:RecA family profile 1 domain-containing protein n=1 Tax=Ranatra chinensis TaxID=642074 RepID=A0ABD0ZA89_9HEMI
MLLVLGGGVPVRGITELSGESGVGKTQICLQLSLTVQYPIDMGGLDSGAVYICTEDRFPSTRLHQILKEQSSNPQSRQPIPNLNFADRIYIDHVADVDSLKECIAVRLPRLLSNLKIGLVVLDSVAAVFRCDYEGLAQSNRRAHQIRMIAIKLHSLARTYNLAILAVNQVTANMDDGRSIPALGLTWANVVTTKLEVTAHRQPCLDSSWRELNLISAPDLPPASAIFCITSAGVSDVPQE